jgi:hypothetical protein
MFDAQRFSYKIIDSSLGLVDRMPYLPIMLSLNSQSLNAEGLLDTGASVNVLPYELGLQLGLIWENETLSVVLEEIWLDLKLAQSLLMLKSVHFQG